jgi:hypothetical protein
MGLVCLRCGEGSAGIVGDQIRARHALPDQIYPLYRVDTALRNGLKQERTYCIGDGERFDNGHACDLDRLSKQHSPTQEFTLGVRTLQSGYFYCPAARENKQSYCNVIKPAHLGVVA